ncbi:serine hydrolase domain-containing protein [Roseateles sp. BYS78W]|uniref:Serine hydrolase domain-containing protein n=1 Tax=Pelomonas candidula TaxID=3299025 RepID=A0ABW7H9G8_9BURK
MNMTRREHLSILTTLWGMGAGPALAADPPLYGTWTGILDLGNVQLTLRLVIDGKGVLAISVDQGGASVAGSDVVLEGERVSVNFKKVRARFEGSLADADHIDGVFTQARPVKLRLARGEVAEPVTEQVWPPLTRELLDAKRAAAATPAMGAAWSRGARSGLLVSGLRASDANIAVQPEDQWHWGSITKSMTATLCARLVEAGVIRWDTTIAQILDDVDATVPQPYRDATLVHLLSHRAGLQSNVTKINEFSLALADARVERLRYVRLALAQKPVGALGAQLAYSNNGYIVAGAMLEKLTGKPWENLIQTEVFAPLGIKHAGQGAPGAPGRLDQPVGHAVADGKRQPHRPGRPDDDNPVALGPAGRVHMPLADMLVYLCAHLNRPSNFLQSASWDKLHTPHFGDSYALGWETGMNGRLSHGGSNTMWFAEVMIDRKMGTVCAACANDAAESTRSAVQDLLQSARATSLSGE